MVSGQSFGSSVVSLACITSMCSVQCFIGGHSLRSALGSRLEGAGLPAMGAQLCLGAGCAKVEAPGHPGHPPPLVTQLLIMDNH